MRALFYHPNCGLSGDMNLAALLQLGVPLAHLEDQLSALGLDDEYKIEATNAAKMGIHGLKVQVRTAPQHHHRHHSDIVKMITAAGYNPAVAAKALAMFEIIAQAEARIHQVPLADVHFHEVGAIDSIVDVVGAAICLDYLKVDAVYATPIEVGGGYVDCAHGRLPVPAPATQEILMGMPCTYGGVNGECTTPTGAAILRASKTHSGTPDVFIPTQTAYAVGHKDFERPNVLRVVLGEAEQATARGETPTGEIETHYKTETHYKIEANIDDMTAEAFEPLSASLFAAGASDVYSEAITMKKSRPAICLNVLCPGSELKNLVDLIFNQTTTIGLRVFAFDKYILEREEIVVATELGPIRIKQVRQPNGRTRWKSEHDDVLIAAKAAGLDYQSAKARVDYAIESQMRDKPVTGR